MGNVPEDGPVLLVGNHTGGNMAPEVIVLPARLLDLLRGRAALLPARPQPRPRLPVRAAPCAATGRWPPRTSTPSGRSTPARRCSSSRAATGRSTARAGRATDRLRRPQGLHPPGARTPTCRSSRWSRSAARRRRSSSAGGAWLAKLTGVDKRLRLKVLPISIALPWGLNVGDLLGHIPLPAKITIEVLPPIDLREQFGPEPDVDEVYEHVTGVMQDALDGLAAERRFPVHRLMRLRESIVISAPPRADLGLPARTRQRAPLHVRRHPLGGRGRQALRASAPATGC